MLKRASFWNYVTQSGQMTLGVAQGIAVAADSQHVWNYLMAGLQIGLGLVSIWTVDRNRNDIIDILETPVVTTVTVEAPGPATVKVEKETKEPPASGGNER